MRASFWNLRSLLWKTVGEGGKLCFRQEGSQPLSEKWPARGQRQTKNVKKRAFLREIPRAMFPAALLQAVQLLRAIAPGLLAVYAFTLILLAAHMLAGKRFP